MKKIRVLKKFSATIAGHIQAPFLAGREYHDVPDDIAVKAVKNKQAEYITDAKVAPPGKNKAATPPSNKAG